MTKSRVNLGKLRPEIGLDTTIARWIRFLRCTQPAPTGLDRGWRFAVAAILISFAAAVVYGAYARIGTDDALIYFTAARNMAEGYGPVVNPGDDHAPITSLLWVATIACAHRVFPSLEMTVIGYGLAIVSIFGAGLLLAFSLRTELNRLALLAPVAIVSTSLYLRLPGLETPLLVFAASAVVWAALGRRSWTLTAVFLVAAFFCRGDAVLFAVPVGWLFLRQAQSQGWPRDVRLAVARAFIVGVVLLSAGLWLQWSVFGGLFPSTLGAKVVQGTVGPWPAFGAEASKYVAAALAPSKMLLPLALIGMMVIGRHGFVFGITAGPHWVLYGLMSVPDYPWYSWILQLAVRLGLVFGGAVVLVAIVRAAIGPVIARDSRIVVVLLCSGLVLGPIVVAGSPPTFDQDPTIVWNGHFRSYRAIAEVLSREAAESEGIASFLGTPVVLAEEIGALSYYCENLQVRDVNGLATPGISESTMNNWHHWVGEYHPRYLVLRGKRPQTLTYGYSEGRPEDWISLTYDRFLLKNDPQFIPLSVYRLVASEPAVKSGPVYLTGSRVQFGSEDSNRFLWQGWSIPEGSFRWSESNRSLFLFRPSHAALTQLRMELSCFDHQHVQLALNGRRFASFECRQGQPRSVMQFELPSQSVREVNALSFHLPDAKSPRSLGESGDTRNLGVAVSWLEMQ